MLPSLGGKYAIEIEVISKPKAEFLTDEYFALDLPMAPAVAGSVLFWAVIAVAWGAYLLLCRLQAVYAGEEYQGVKAVFGYGLIPLILGGYLAFYAKMFILGAWRFLPNLLFLH